MVLIFYFSVKYCKMVTPVETRWNSSLMMMRSVLQLRPALEAVKECTHRSTDARLQYLVPEKEEFELLESIVPILTKFEAVSDFMSGESYPTICHVMVKICFLQLTLKKAIETDNQGLEDDSLREMCANMAKDLEKRFPNYGANEKAYAYSHLLHPGQKGTILYQLSIYNQTVQKMLEDEETATAETGLDVAMQVLDEEEDEEQAMLASMSQNMPKPNNNDDTPMMKEVIAFINGGLVPGKNLDVLAYWKNHEKQFPLLARVVRKYFCIQSTSCSSERTFSTGGSTVTAKRTKLDPINVNMLVYLRENMNKIKLEKLILETKEEEEIENECNVEK
jgi:hypothetical protein